MAIDRATDLCKSTRRGNPDLLDDEHHLVRPFCSVRWNATGSCQHRKPSADTLQSTGDSLYVSIKLDVDFSLQMKNLGLKLV